MLAAIPLNAEGLSEASTLRESGKTLDAIASYNHEIVQATRDEKYETVCNALTERLISWQHLWNAKHDRVYAILAMKDAEALEDISNHHHLNDKKHLVLFLKGKAHYMLGEYSKARDSYSKAISFYPFDHGEKGDWIAHHGHMMMLAGDKENGKGRILEGIEQINEHRHEIDSFRINVWISGAYLRLARCLKDSHPVEALTYLQLAQELIDNDERLVVRKAQLEQLQKEWPNLNAIGHSGHQTKATEHKH